MNPRLKKKLISSTCVNFCFLYSYFYFSLSLRRRVVLHYFFFCKTHRLLLERIVRYYNNNVINFNFDRANSLFLVMFRLNNFNLYTTWKNFNMRRSCYSVDSSILNIVNYSVNMSLKFNDYVNSLDAMDFFWEIWDKQKPHVILGKETRIKHKKHIFITDENLTEANYIWSERYKNDKILFYNSLAGKTELWRLVSLVTTIGLMGYKIEIARWGLFKHVVSIINYYSFGFSEKGSSLLIYVNSDRFRSLKKLSDKNKKFLMSQNYYLDIISTAGLVDSYIAMNFFDYVVPIDRESPGSSYVFLMFIFESYAIGKKLRFRLLKSSYLASRLRSEAKKCFLRKK